MALSKKSYFSRAMNKNEDAERKKLTKAGQKFLQVLCINARQSKYTIQFPKVRIPKYYQVKIIFKHEHTIS